MTVVFCGGGDWFGKTSGVVKTGISERDEEGEDVRRG